MSTKRITEVWLLNTPLENEYKHTLWFKEESDQKRYFRELRKEEFTFEDLSYQRKDSVIRIPMHYDELIGKVNYVAFRNPYYSNKWFYAFITRLDYSSDGLTNVYIETDVIQTWLFEYKINPSFVEREHVSDDIPGHHTQPENLEVGEYMCQEKIQDPITDDQGYCIVVGTTAELHTGSMDGCAGTMYGKIYSGLKYYAYDSPNQINNLLVSVVKAGKGDAITAMFMCPKSFLNINEDTREILSSRLDEYDWSLMNTSFHTKLGSYTPRNKKLLTYPYSYILMSNNCGSAAIYKYELFDGGTNLMGGKWIKFGINGCITPGFSGRLIPKNYNGVDENNEEGLNLGKYPICSWATDVYTNWLTQNSLNIQTSLATSGISALTSAISGNVAGIGSSLSQVTSTLCEVNTKSFQPPQAEGNINSGDVNFTSGNIRFTAYRMCVKEEYAKIIDDYFTMFGYKVNRVKVPNADHRQNFWFTKTIDANIVGPIPTEDLNVIRKCYNTGITFWRRPEIMRDYSLQNLIL